MAILRHDRRTGFWQIRFYWDGNQQERSCRTKHRSKAQRTQAAVGETIDLLRSGRITMPEDVDPVDWIVSGGKLQSKSVRHGEVKDQRFGRICDAYLKDQPQKQATTTDTEKTHVRHLKRILKASTLMKNIDLDALKEYRRRRNSQKFHGRPISDATIKKELVTFRQIWTWAKQNDYLDIQCPLLDEGHRWKIQFEKKNARDKFKTWDQIERQINRGGLTDDQMQELWEGLYLDQSQVCEMLSHVETQAAHSFIHPMFAFAAYTGARRSEILRSEIEDFDFEAKQITLRERKRRKDRQGSTRLVPLHPKLKIVMQVWFANHPGGTFTIAPPKKMPRRRKTFVPASYLTPDQARHHFDATLQGSKWNVINGFHVLRHSFGSNLIRSGTVSSDVVAKWMGHSTMEMRELYQHLFPQDGVEQIKVLS